MARRQGGETPNRYRLRYRERDLVVAPGEYSIGRASDCKLVLDGALVSRHHARLLVTEDSIVIEDLHSKNGVRVNNEPIDGRRSLDHGDLVNIGVSSIVVLQEALLFRAETLSTFPPSSRVRVAGATAAPDSEEETRTTSLLEKLSKREQEVFELVVRGFTRREIAKRLFVSVKTVDAHRCSIGDKLGARTRAELVNFAIIAGVLRPQGAGQ